MYKSRVSKPHNAQSTAGCKLHSNNRITASKSVKRSSVDLDYKHKSGAKKRSKKEVVGKSFDQLQLPSPGYKRTLRDYTFRIVPPEELEAKSKSNDTTRETRSSRYRRIFREIGEFNRGGVNGTEWTVKTVRVKGKLVKVYGNEDIQLKGEL